MLPKHDFYKKNSLGNKKLPDNKKASPLAIAFFFFSIIGLTFLMQSWKNIKAIINNYFQPTTYQIIKPWEENIDEYMGFQPNLRDIEGLKKAINLTLDSSSGTYGIYFYNFKSKESLGVNEDQIYIVASVNKIFIMVSFYEQVEKGILNEDQEYILQSADIQDFGSGQMRYQAPGTIYSYSDLINLTGINSDNTAAYVLENIIGGDITQSSINKLGFTNTSLEDNTSTPKEIAKYLQDLYEDKIINQKHKFKVLDALTATDYEDRIPMGLPNGVRVAHKIGNGIQIYSDCGIVLTGKPYILCVLTKEVHEEEALKIIPKISRLTWEYVNKNN